MIFAQKLYALSSIDLTEEGRPLYHHRVQDQDGLGTCYANASATILQGVLSGNPEVSYFDVALKYKKNNSYDGSSGDYLDFGYICDSIKSLKNSGSVCERSDTLFERFSIHGDSQDLSLELLKKLDKVYDSLDRLNPKEARYFIENMEKVFNEQKDLARKNCEQLLNKRREKLGIYNVLSRVAYNLDDKINRLKKQKNKTFEEQMDLKKLKEIKKVLKNKTVIKIENEGFPVRVFKDRYQIEKTKTLEAMVENLYVKKVKAMESSELDKFKELEEEVFRHLGLSEFPELTKNSFDMNLLGKEKRMLDPEFCAKAEASNYMSHYSNIEKIHKNLIKSCGFEYQTNSLSNLFSIIDTDLSFLNGDKDRSIFNLLFNYKDKNDLVRNIIGANCPGQSISIPKNLECRSTDLRRLYLQNNKDKSIVIKKMREKIHFQLAKDRPIGVSLCTNFLIKKGEDSNFGEESLCNVNGKNRFHAMAVVGFKEMTNGNGEVTRKYLLQNSWGEDCGYFVDKKSCIGNTGRFWVDENELLLNVREIDEIDFI